MCKFDQILAEMESVRDKYDRKGLEKILALIMKLQTLLKNLGKSQAGRDVELTRQIASYFWLEEHERMILECSSLLGLIKRVEALREAAVSYATMKRSTEDREVNKKQI